MTTTGSSLCYQSVFIRVIILTIKLTLPVSQQSNSRAKWGNKMNRFNEQVTAVAQPSRELWCQSVIPVFHSSPWFASSGRQFSSCGRQKSSAVTRDKRNLLEDLIERIVFSFPFWDFFLLYIFAFTCVDREHWIVHNELSLTLFFRVEIEFCVPSFWAITRVRP